MYGSHVDRDMAGFDLRTAYAVADVAASVLIHHRQQPARRT
jgi:hypothetical protein